MLTTDEVRQLALAGRVKQDATYHGRQHYLSFEDCVYVLVNCYSVEPDRRLGPDGKLRHPDGYVAFGHLSRSRRVRVDFNLTQDEGGNLILVVTAIPY